MSALLRVLFPETFLKCYFSRNQGNEIQLVILVNQVRIQYRLDILSSMIGLAALALVHSTDMGCSNFVGQ
jgi:uncharacterized protein YkwD